MDNTFLFNKIAALPENLKSEVARFIDSLMGKEKKPGKHKPKFGSAKGIIQMKENFDDPIEDFNRYQ